MSDKGFQADPAALRQHADRFGDFAGQASAIHRELSTALDGAPWGDDAAGQAFAAGHVGAANDTVERLGALSGRLTDVGSRFTETAARYEQTEQANADALRARER